MGQEGHCVGDLEDMGSLRSYPLILCTHCVVAYPDSVTISCLQRHNNESHSSTVQMSSYSFHSQSKFINLVQRDVPGVQQTAGFYRRARASVRLRLYL